MLAFGVSNLLMLGITKSKGNNTYLRRDRFDFINVHSSNQKQLHTCVTIIALVFLLICDM